MSVLLSPVEYDHANINPALYKQVLNEHLFRQLSGPTLLKHIL